MKIIIATGGTGGHLFPALKVAGELKGAGHHVLFLGSFRRAEDQMRKSGFTFEDLGSKGFVSSSLRNKFQSALAMVTAVFRALGSLRRFQPDVVCGFGGYGAFPAVLAAVVLRCPTLIHEQNVVPGLANRILAGVVDKIAVSFEKSRKYFNPRKTVLTGYPSSIPPQDIDRASVFKEFGLREGRATILVFGGSQGSGHINKTFVETARALKEKLDFQVVHLSGDRDYLYLRDRYNEMGIPVALFKFLDKMDMAYRAADLVVARSGAGTVTEIAKFQLPAVFIPYPHARGHQKENALVLCGAGPARLIEDKDLSSAKLTDVIVDLLKSPSIREEAEGFVPARPSGNRLRYAAVGETAAIFFPDASQRVAREVLELAQ
jgi:UDP-N-acetylglucosamine--N-acetylmuramyl-(pentapeptide) pyrophosphoryl-undecaprenol N-acetylglucosamine transferase